MRVASRLTSRSPLTLLRSLFLALLMLAASIASAAPGALIGKTLVAIPHGDNLARAIAVQPDGKILAAGFGWMGSKQLSVTRYNADGTVDTSFANAGTLLEPLGPGNGEARGVAVTSDGKIVIGGFARADTGRFGIARFNSDGSLDTSFGGGGRVTLVGRDSGGNAMAMQSDGKVVLGGWSIPSGGSHRVFTLVRYNTDSSLDTSFGAGGVVTEAEGTTDHTINAIAIQPDGKIVAAGDDGSGVAVRRYNGDGSVDGSWIATSNSGITGGNALAIQPDGAIVVAGTVPIDSGNSGAGLFRLTSSGVRDSSFDGGAIKVVSQGQGAAATTTTSCWRASTRAARWTPRSARTASRTWTSAASRARASRARCSPTASSSSRAFSTPRRPRPTTC
jgi:uncharacterized delta-60 repeat protein